MKANVFSILRTTQQDFFLELHTIMLIKPGTYSKEQPFVKAPNSVFLCLFCLRATQNKALSFLRAALIRTAGVVERCELPALTFPACPRSPLKPLGPSFVLSAGAEPRAQSCFESAGWLESAAHSQWKGTVRQKFGRTFWFWFTSYIASNSEGVKWQDLWWQRKHNIITQNMHFSKCGYFEEFILKMTLSFLYFYCFPHVRL